MKSEPIKRNRYSDPPFNEGDFSARNFDEDFNEFHLPLNQMQLANFQEWGVAQGLEVRGSIGGTTITIAPGVAADIQGQLISLATEGKGDIGSNPPSEEHQEVDVPVILELSRFAETENTSYFVTIQFSQILRFDEGPLGRYEDVPWIRLQAVDEFVEDGNSLVLARVTINSNGELTELHSQGRRLASKTVQELSLRRPQLVDDRVQQVSAGKLASTVNGLEITLPNTVDELLLSQKDGDNFTQLTVNADNSNFRGNINATQNLQVEGAIASSSLTVNGNSNLNQNLQVEGAIAASSLTVNGNSNLNQNLQVEGALAVNDNTNIQGNLTVSGNLEVQGDVTARDVEHVSGNVSFGDEDNDEVKITGVLRSGHSSGALQVNSNMDLTGNLGIGTTSLGAKLHIVHANQNANGNSLIIGPTNQSNLRLGYDREYSWIQSHGSKPLAINSVGNNVGIGTTNPRTKLEVVGTIKATKIEGEGAVVAGMIMMWSGQVNNIPNGWSLCDGRNGTPDLRDRFIVGVGRKYGVGDQGGQDSVTLSIDQMPSHNHANGEYRYLLQRHPSGKYTVQKIDTTRNEVDIIHSRSMTSQGRNQAHENRPPYYALCFIIKI